MAHENKGLPGLYEKKRERRAVANAPYQAKRNSDEIIKLKGYVKELEKRILILENLLIDKT